MTDESVSPAPAPTVWLWVACAATLALCGLGVSRLITLIRWEHTLIFARDLLPAAIGTEAITLAAELAILACLVMPRGRRWGFSLAIAWGAITAGIWLWPHAQDAWYQVAWRLHLAKSLRRVIVLGGSGLRLKRWRAGIAFVMALTSGKGFADMPRDQFDRGVLQVCIFFAVFYFIVMGIVSRSLIVQ